MSDQFDDLLDRLYACNQEISGFTPYREPPAIAKNSAFPMLYCVLTGYTEQPPSGKLITATYNVTMQLLTTPLDRALKVNTSGTAKGVSDTQTHIKNVVNYYRAHRYLHTAALVRLGFITNALIISNSGVEMPLPGYDGEQYIGTSFELNIQTILSIL